MSKVNSMAEWLEIHHLSYPAEVAVSNRLMDQTILAAYQKFLLPQDNPPYSYKRYGYLLSNLLAQFFAFDIKAHSLNYSGRLFNCGMAAISTILETLELKPGDRIVCSNILYSETPRELKSLERFGIEVVAVDQSSLVEIINAVDGGNTKLVFVETVGNGPTMPVVDLPGLLESVSEKDITIVLDNTFFTTELYNPFDQQQTRILLSRGKFRFIYLESGSKFYRTKASDDVTLGIVIAPNDFIPILDSTTSRRGSYLQFQNLLCLPSSLVMACDVVRQHSANALAIYNWLKVQNWVEPVYPAVPYAKGNGAIIYARVKSDSVKQVQQFLVEAELVQVGSFGHAYTSVIHFGKYPEFGYPAGQIRLAIGYQEDTWDTTARMDSAVHKVLGV